MAITNFAYDGINLSVFDDGKYIIAYFSIDSAPTEPQKIINQTSLFMGKERPFIYSTYENTISFTISIIKNPCIITNDEQEITILEMERLKRWLCRSTPHKFYIMNDLSNIEGWFNGKNEYDNIYWEGTFSLQEEIIGGKRIGATLTFLSTAPFGFQDDIIFTGSVNAEDSITINDISEEIGYIYPQMIITCAEAGNLTIFNNFDGRATIINNCEQNEIITFSKYMQIETSSNTHLIYNDFNYTFLRLCNDYNNNENTISFSKACDYEIRYNPIRKVIPI